MRRRKAARVMMGCLMNEVEDVKTDEQLTIEGWLWKQMKEPGIAEIVLGARKRATNG